MSTYRPVYRSVYRPVYRSVLAGGASAFSLASLNPYFLVESDSGVLNGSGTQATDGQTVANWTSQDSGAKTATQATDENRFVFKTGIVNGLPVLRASSSDVITTLICDFGETITQPNTIVAIARSNFSNFANLFDGITATDRHVLFRDVTNYQAYAGNFVQSVAAADATDFHIFACEFNGASSKIYIDGNLDTSGDAGSQSLTGLTIGANYIPGTPWVGDIAMLMIVDGLLSAEDLAATHAFLSNKYGIAIS